MANHGAGIGIRIRPAPNRRRPAPITDRPAPNGRRPAPITDRPAPNEVRPVPTAATVAEQWRRLEHGWRRLNFRAYTGAMGEHRMANHGAGIGIRIRPAPNRRRPAPITDRPAPNGLRPAPITDRPAPNEVRPVPNEVRPVPTAATVAERQASSVSACTGPRGGNGDRPGLFPGWSPCLFRRWPGSAARPPCRRCTGCSRN